MNNIQSKTIVFITGAFVSHTCWNLWKFYFENKGYSCLAPPWPFKGASPNVLRNAQPNKEIASVRLQQLIDHYANIAGDLAEKPILIGHSLGGLITQILLERGLGEAGVAIHSVPPQGIIPRQFSFYRSTWKALGFLSSIREAYLMAFNDWQYAFTNDMPFAEQAAAYENFVIPESKVVLRDGLTSVAKINFKKSRGPLLLTAGSIDNCIPAALNVQNHHGYRNNKSITDFKLFEGRNHFVLGQPTWKEDADFILDWINSH